LLCVGFARAGIAHRFRSRRSAVVGKRLRFRGKTRRVGMSPASSNLSFAVRFRPVGPWRFGPDSGARDRVDLIYHSDAVFSAVCSAMSQLGLAQEWLGAA